MIPSVHFTSHFDAVANAKTGTCFGAMVILPPAQWINSTTFRKSLTHLDILSGRSVIVCGNFFSPDEGAKSLSTMGRYCADQNVQMIVSLSDVPMDRDQRLGLLNRLRGQSVPTIFDTFGETPDSLPLILDCEPDFIRLSPKLIAGIASEARRRVLVANVVGMAHTLGIEVLASGVDTADDFKVCRDLGVDLVQGLFVHPSQSDLADIPGNFVHLVPDQSFHNRSVDRRWITQQIDLLPALSVDTPVRTVFDQMARNLEQSTVMPLVDRDRRPLGLLEEKTFKNLAYSAYGRELVSNRGWGKSLRDFVTRCPIAESATPLDQMLAVYSTASDAPGILITEGGAYAGFLSAPSLIRALHERTLARAQDENPLTRLPGNTMIGDYVVDCLSANEAVLLAYVDFDNFKPFNDTYGFRLGDRAILLFADLMRKAEQLHGWFIGHIGGDDFFIGAKQTAEDETIEAIRSLISTFESDAQSFYDPESRQRGYIEAHDRDGNPRQFPLLSASVVVAILEAGTQGRTVDDISVAIAAQKKEAKNNPSKLAVVRIA